MCVCVCVCVCVCATAVRCRQSVLRRSASCLSSHQPVRHRVRRRNTVVLVQCRETLRGVCVCVCVCGHLGVLCNFYRFSFLTWSKVKLFCHWTLLVFRLTVASNKISYSIYNQLLVSDLLFLTNQTSPREPTTEARRRQTSRGRLGSDTSAPRPAPEPN